MKKSLVLTLSSLIILSACGAKPPVKEASSSSSTAPEAVSSERVIRETKNVSYSGTVRTLGISIYMEGTHRLSLQDGRFILLESDSADLNGYVGETVDVLGAIRPTVESDAMIMRVETISLQKEEPTEDISEDVEGAEDLEESDQVSSASSTAEVEEASEDTIAAVVEEAPQEEIGGSEETVASPEFLARQEKMASEEFTAVNWTQEYCTAHIGFCIPVHRNWWFKSFGATSTHYWHVEMNSGPLEELNQGPLVVNLDGESLKALDIEDGSIHTDGENVTGYRNWTNGRHFKIQADASLRDAVEYITRQLKPQE